ncbi:hypothetical protein VQ042_10750 [Aurantimonas sp. A2-1-M11]|uniref:hypothetical protein n=1 Tax=Aurantimonas sp. A2-1-M11 TaxID=3113712 RepID=UPI002F938E36
MIAGLSVLAAIGFSVLLMGSDSGAAAMAENSPHELLQAGTIALAALVFFLAALRFDFEIFYVTLLGSFGSSMALLRETSSCTSDFYTGGPCLTATSKDLIPLAMAVVAVALLLYRRVRLARHIRELSLFWLVPVGFSTLFLVIAELAEANIAVWVEETMELAAFANLLAFAVVIHLQPRWFGVTLRWSNTVPAERPSPAQRRDHGREIMGQSARR